MAMSADAGEEIVATLGRSSANSSDQRATGEDQERERIRSTSGGEPRMETRYSETHAAGADS
jgi:hypothetical protein